MKLKGFGTNRLVNEFVTKVSKKTNLNDFKRLKEQLQCLSAISSGVQQTVVDELTDKWTKTFLILKIHCLCKGTPF